MLGTEAVDSFAQELPSPHWASISLPLTRGARERPEKDVGEHCSKG